MSKKSKGEGKEVVLDDLGKRRDDGGETYDDVEVVDVSPPPLPSKPSANSKKAANKISTSALFRFADGWDKLMVFIVILSGIGSGVLFPLFVLTLGDLADCFSGSMFGFTNATSSASGSNTFESLIWECCWKLLIFGAIDFVLHFLLTYCSTVTATRQADTIRKKYFDAVMSQEIGWFDGRQTGSLTTSLSSIQRIQDGLGASIGIIMQCYASFIGGFIVAFIASWKLALVTLAMMPIVMTVSSVMWKLVGGMPDYYIQAGKIAEEAISCIRTVVTLGIQNIALARFDVHLQAAHKMGNKKGVAMAMSFGVLNSCLFGSFGLIFWYGGSLVTDGEITAGNVVVVFTGLMMGMITASTVSPQNMKLADACTAAFEIYGTIDRQSQIDPRKDKNLSDEANNYVIKGDVEFRNVVFRYPTRPDVQVLKNFNLTIPSGKTTAIVGPSGCGKSTIVGLIERFYDCEDGFGQVLIDGHDIKGIGIKNLRRQIGIVAQEPVLFATSIAQNIAWGIPITDSKAKDSVTMDDIVAAAKMANADGFISKLSDGYNTLVGQRGGLLSGGQKQRIAIARALIRKPKIVIFDEATSALDRNSEAEVQKAIDKVTNHCTCIIIAHRLSTVQNADQIVTVSDGKVVEQGTHKELMAIENGVYRGLVERQQTDEEEEKKKTSNTATKTTKAEESASSNSSSADEASSDGGEDEKNKKELKMVTAEPTNEEIAAEQNEVKKAKSKVILRAFRMLGPNAHLIFFAVLTALLNGAMMPCFALLLSEIAGVMLYDPNNPGSVSSSEHESDLRIWSLGFLCLGVGTFFTYLIQYTCSSIASERLAHHLRYESFKAIMRQEMGWFDDKRNMTGVLTTRLATDSMLIHSLTSNQLTTIIQVVSSFACGIIVGLLGSWKVGLVCLACLPVLLLTNYINKHLAEKYAQRVKVAYEESGRIASEALENVRTVVSIGREATFLEQFSEQLRRPIRMGLSTNLIHAISSAVESLFQFWLTALAFWYGSKLMMEPGSTVTLVDVMKAELGVMFGAQGMEQVSAFFPDYAKTTTAAYNTFKLLDRKPLVPYPEIVGQSSFTGMKSLIKKEEKKDKDEDARRKLDSVCGKIVFKDVQFSYPTRPDVPVLKGLSFEVKPKQTVALVGESGCGKSTVVSLLERLYLPSGGSIELDDVPIDELDIAWLRSQIGLVSQEPVLFATSIYENIRYGNPEATKEEIEEAAKKANAHCFIMSFPDGYNTPVGEKGITLSGGQKQRIAIARALVRNPKVLLLDEATSALDSESEKVVQEALDRATVGRTTIVIAHRLSTIENADLILVIKDGAIVEKGTHKSLMSNPDSVYATLSRAQSGSQ